MIRKTIVSTALLAATTCIAGQHKIAEERDGFVAFEAESFAEQTNDEIRRWYVITPDMEDLGLMDHDENHAESASGKAYLEILPDTRWTHDEELIHGENFMTVPGKMAVLTYPIKFNTPGTYYVWGSAFSTGPEDNGLHIGINGTWPASGERLQWCQGKHKWTWSSAQRVPNRHCGYPKTITIEVPSAGVHNIQFSMREDGVELDRFILVNDRHFDPEGFEMPEQFAALEAAKQDDGGLKLPFTMVEEDAAVVYYHDKNRDSFAINAAKVEFREGFAAATAIFTQPEGIYDLKLNTFTEEDGESTYNVYIDDRLVASLKNPKTEKPFEAHQFGISGLTINPGSVIKVESNAHTNGKIPEGDGTAWARGRWSSLIAYPVK